MTPVVTFANSICRRCHQTLSTHAIYHDAPPPDVEVQYGEFDIPATGFVCPTVATTPS